MGSREPVPPEPERQAVKHDAEAPGSATFRVPAADYDRFIGRYSQTLAQSFGDFCLPDRGRFLDVGCGPGALTAVAVQRLGEAAVSAIDPAPQFVEACRARHPGVDVRRASAEALPFEPDSFAGAAAQLVFHFIAEPSIALAQMRTVVEPGGTVAAAVWDAIDGMQMLDAFWDAAAELGHGDPRPDSRGLRLGRPDELASVWRPGGLDAVTETTITVTADYSGFDELWDSILTGTGPAGAFAVSLDGATRDRLRELLLRRLGRPEGAFELSAVARAVRGVVAEKTP